MYIAYKRLNEKANESQYYTVVVWCRLKQLEEEEEEEEEEALNV